MLALLLLQAAANTRALDLRPPSAARLEVEQVVADGFPRFDSDGDGSIGAHEFGRWMAALTPAAAAGAVAQAGWSARAFAQADGDASGALSRSEVAQFLTEAVSWRLPVKEEGSGSGR